ncbi:hypothetical protein ACHAWF_015686 [Thalassiosira exigua]
MKPPGLLLTSLWLLLSIRVELASSQQCSYWHHHISTCDGLSVTSTFTFWVTSAVGPTYDAEVTFHWGPSDTSLGVRTYPSDVGETVGSTEAATHVYDEPGEHYIGYRLEFPEESGSGCDGATAVVYQIYRTRDPNEGGNCGFEEVERGAAIPTREPSDEPTPPPSRWPSVPPTRPPSKGPTVPPTSSPSRGSTKAPTRAPSSPRPTTPAPSRAATETPTRGPTRTPASADVHLSTPLPSATSVGAATVAPTGGAAPAANGGDGGPTRAPVAGGTRPIPSPPTAPGGVASTTRPTEPVPSPAPDVASSTETPEPGGASPASKPTANGEPVADSDPEPAPAMQLDSAAGADPGGTEGGGVDIVWIVVAGVFGGACLVVLGAGVGIYLSRRIKREQDVSLSPVAKEEGSGDSDISVAMESQRIDVQTEPETESKTKPETESSTLRQQSSSFGLVVESKEGEGDDVSTLGEPYFGDAEYPPLDGDITVGPSVASTQQDLYVYGVRRPHSNLPTGASRFGGSTVGSKALTFGEDSQLEDSYQPSPGTSTDEGQSDLRQYTVVAPPGKLGIVLDNPTGGMPVVYAIQETSALSGKISVGDALLSIDGVDCRGLSAHELSTFLGGLSRNPARTLVLTRGTGRAAEAFAAAV